jgi:hypothetical protein
MLSEINCCNRFHPNVAREFQSSGEASWPDAAPLQPPRLGKQSAVSGYMVSNQNKAALCKMMSINVK